MDELVVKSIFHRGKLKNDANRVISLRTKGGESAKMGDEIGNVGETANDVFEFINALPAEALDSLYGAKTADEKNTSLSTSSTYWACCAIFQSLSPLAKQYVMRLLCVQQPIPFSTLNSWASVNHTQAHNEVSQKLCLI